MRMVAIEPRFGFTNHFTEHMFQNPRQVGKLENNYHV